MQEFYLAVYLIALVLQLATLVLALVHLLFAPQHVETVELLESKNVTLELCKDVYQTAQDNKLDLTVLEDRLHLHQSVMQYVEMD